MALFSSVMDGYEVDPIFGSASRMMRQMDSMMSSVMRDPFGGDPFGGMMGGSMLMGPPAMRHSMPMQPAIENKMNPMSLMANPMAMMNTVMSNMDHVRGDCSSQVFSSSSVMTMTTGPDGKPQVKMANKSDGSKSHMKFEGGRSQVYQSSMMNRSGPGGVRETQHAVSDSRSGVKKLAIGHHIGDRGHIIERERNPEGEEERREFLNIDEEEADEFEHEFKNRAGHRRAAAISNSPARASETYGRYGGTQPQPLAIEDSRPRTEPRRVDTDVRYSTENMTPYSSSSAGLDRSAYRHYRPNTSYTPSPTTYARPLSYSGYTSRTPYTSRYASRYSRGRNEVPRYNNIQDSRYNRRTTPYN